ncbi:glycoside hydrolase family 5 protein [soil metagenome]
MNLLLSVLFSFLAPIHSGNSSLALNAVVAPPVGEKIAPINRMTVFAKAEKAPTAIEINQKMATGFNLGNTFDGSQNSAEFTKVRPLIDLYRSAGMKHIRIPVTWMEGFTDNLADSSGNLNKKNPRLKQLEKTVDYCLKNGMVVMINAHHERWLKNNYDGSQSFKSRFSNLWTGIANEFKNRSSNLIFEVLNEPEGNLGDWNHALKPSDPLALTRTREVNQLGYDAIRRTGGSNSTRVVVVAPNGLGNQSMFKQVYPSRAELPGAGKDPFVMVSVHTYDPWVFCGDNGTLAAHPSDDEIRKPILEVAAHAAELGVAVNYGEFGVGRRERYEERDTDVVRNYYRTVRQTALSKNMSVTPWDDRGWFGLVKPTADGKFKFVFDIVPSMMRGS